jgi:hypothetical protein
MHDGDNHHKRRQKAIFGAAGGAVTTFGSQNGKAGWVNENLTFDHATPQVVSLPSGGPGRARKELAAARRRIRDQRSDPRLTGLPRQKSALTCRCRA